MGHFTFVQNFYLVLLTLLFSWSLASMVSVAGTRCAVRQCSSRSAFAFDTSVRRLRAVAFVTFVALFVGTISWALDRAWLPLQIAMLTR